MRRIALPFAVVFLLAAAPVAHADVLVHAPDRVIDCGEPITVGVWYQEYSGGPRWAKIRILTQSGRLLARKRVRATTEWRYWEYDPDCARRYKIRYIVPGGRVTFPVRVRG